MKQRVKKVIVIVLSIIVISIVGALIFQDKYMPFIATYFLSLVITAQSFFVGMFLFVSIKNYIKDGEF